MKQKLAAKAPPTKKLGTRNTPVGADLSASC